MRILIVSQYFWPENFRINDVVLSLQAEGCAVTVLTGQPNYPAGTIMPGYRAASLGRDGSNPAYTIYRVPLIPRGRGSAFGLFANYLSFVVTASVLAPWLLRGREFDVIFVYGVSPILQAIPAIWLKWIKRAPLVIWVQDLWPQSLEVTGYVKNGTVLGFVGALTRWIYRRCDLVLGQSRAFVRTLVPMARPVPVEFYPTPGDGEVGEIASPAPGVVLPAGFNVLFAGNLGTAQALPTIVDAATRLRARNDIRFVLVGDGTQRAWLAGEIERRGLTNVLLLGQFPGRAMPAIYAQASVLLATLNKSDILAQTIPAKISSYLKAGKPIIAAIDGEGGEVVVSAAAGLACPAEDAEALAAAVLRLASETPERLQKMGASGQAYFDATFDPRTLTLRLVSLLDGVIAGKRRAAARRGAEDAQ